MSMFRSFQFSLCISLLALGGACTTGGDEGGAADANPNTPDSVPGAPDANPDCVPSATPPNNGKHKAGDSCNESGCHDGNGSPPKWTLAGTLYTAKSGQTIVAGATMKFTDANDKVVTVVTSENGNFYTAEAVTFPVTVVSTRCPNLVEKTDHVATGGGSCNKSGCHVANSRIALP